ncbi:MAG: metal ABC transporter permease [Endozoicomonas sp. (ex Botrylloides leachii)]|nr:metal ABC transporter permease [Endozoicomonas sp. (ex Botrylloides leachii)]
MSFIESIYALCLVTSVVCALCGTLLLVSRKTMVSEGLSHALLPGLVIGFILIKDVNSPLLIMCAALSGLVMVWLTQWLSSTHLVDSDAALGLVFSGMFSLGVLIFKKIIPNAHFHADCIIEGALTSAASNSVLLMGVFKFPKSLIIMLILLVICITFLSVCFKEIKLMLFEPLLARRFGFKPALLNYIWLFLVSLITVAGFKIAGSILIVALMIAPPAAAYLLSNRLSNMLIIASIVAIMSSFIGVYIGMCLDIPPTSAIASAAGFVFLLIFIFAPKRGLLTTSLTKIRKKRIENYYIKR